MADVTVETVEPHISVITLNRPDRLNALTFGLTAELHDALDAVGSDPECKVAVLTGAGKGFCAGLDLRDWGTPPAPGEHPHVRLGVGGQEFMANLTVHMRNTPQIIIARGERRRVRRRPEPRVRGRPQVRGPRRRDSAPRSSVPG